MNEIPMFWDHTNRCWIRKKLNLKRVPLKYRCPTCGKIVVKPKDREPIITYWHWGFEKTKSGYDKVVMVREKTVTPGVTAEQVLGGIFGTGGVCHKCWLSGLGKYSKIGKLFAWGMSEDFKKFEDKIIT